MKEKALILALAALFIFGAGEASAFTRVVIGEMFDNTS